jgi:hypothetical protein
MAISEVPRPNLDPFRRIETDITAVLDLLAYAFEHTKDLRTGVAALEEQLQPEKLASIARRQQIVSRFIEEVDTTNTLTVNMVRDLRSQSVTMVRTLRELSQTIQSSNIVSLNARIIAQAHSRQPQGEHLVRLAQNISDISEAASTEAKAMVDVIDGITSLIDQMGQAAEARALAMLRTLRPRAEAMEAALGALETGMDAAREASAWLNTFIDSARTEISAIISALQIGDRSRQRAEHVDLILARARGCVPGSPEAAALSRLGVAQLAQTVEAVLADAQVAQDMMGAFNGRMPDFLQQCDAISKAFGAGIPDGPGPVAPADLASMDALKETARDARVALLDMDTQLQSHSRNLSDSAFHMSLASLNTIVTCARSFRKAQDMIVVSQQINEVISEIPKSFDVFVASMDTTKRNLQQWDELDARQADWNLSDLGEGDGTLRTTRGVLADLLPELAVRPRRIVQAIGDGTERFGAMVRQVAKIGTDNPDNGAHDVFRLGPDDSAFAATLTEIRATYTMQEERDLHDRMFQMVQAVPGPGDLADVSDDAAGSGTVRPASQEAPGTAPESPSAVADELDDIFF